jgi:aminoglycoside phosphotransferase (APT) family kinase protein
MAAFHTAIAPDEFVAWLAAGLPGSALLERADVQLAASTMAAAERDKAVSEDERCFLHGDFGSHNLVVDEQGRITPALERGLVQGLEARLSE